MRLDTIYERLTDTGQAQPAADDRDVRVGSGRERFLRHAEDVARLTIPTIEPRGTEITDPAYSHEGAESVQSLSSKVRLQMMPQDGSWYRVGVNDELQQRIKTQAGGPLSLPGGGQIDVEDALAEASEIAEARILGYLHQRKVTSRVARAITRNLIEGWTVLRVLKDRIDIFPLREIAAWRQRGELQFYVIIELERVKPAEYAEAKRQSKLYTLVDVVNKEVWKSKDGGEARKVDPKVDGGDWRQYVAFEAIIPDTQHYPESFCFQVITLFNEIEELVQDLGSAAAAAAWAVLGVNTNSALNPDEVAQWKPRTAKKFNPGEITWLTSQIKLGDFSLVAARLEQLNAQRRRIFAAGISDREPGDVTATEILRRTEEIDQQTADLMSNYEETLLGPLATAVGVTLGVIPLQVPGLEDAVEIKITAGSSALRRQIGVLRMVQSASIIQKLDPALFNRAEVYKIASAAEGFSEHDDKVLVQAPPTEPPITGAETTAEAVAGSGQATSDGRPQPEPSPEVRQAQTATRAVPTAAA